MPNIDFFGSEEDRIEIIKSILDLKDYGLIPDLIYKKAKPIIYRSFDKSLVEAIKTKSTLYIQGNFSKFPVFMGERNSGSADGTFYIVEAYSGPLLRLGLPSCSILDGKIQLGPGSLSYRPEYWHKNTMRSYKPDEEVAQHYKTIWNTIKLQLVRKKLIKTSWIGLNAWEAICSGNAHFLNMGKWWDKSGNLIRENT